MDIDFSLIWKINIHIVVAMKELVLTWFQYILQVPVVNKAENEEQLSA